MTAVCRGAGSAGSIRRTDSGLPRSAIAASVKRPSTASRAECCPHHSPSCILHPEQQIPLIAPSQAREVRQRRQVLTQHMRLTVAGLELQPLLLARLGEELVDEIGVHSSDDSAVNSPHSTTACPRAPPARATAASAPSGVRPQGQDQPVRQKAKWRASVRRERAHGHEHRRCIRQRVRGSGEERGHQKAPEHKSCGASVEPEPSRGRQRFPGSEGQLVDGDQNRQVCQQVDHPCWLSFAQFGRLLFPCQAAAGFWRDPRSLNGVSSSWCPLWGSPKRSISTGLPNRSRSMSSDASSATCSVDSSRPSISARS